MDAFIKALKEIEDLIYKILVWIVLIPKTILQLVLHPDWASGYIKDELDPKTGKSRFDEYFSPVVLLLVVALIPFIVWSFLPIPGVEITSPSTENPSGERTVDFDANIKFISTSTDGFITTFWRVEQERYDGSKYSYPVLKQNRYTSNPRESNSVDYFNYYQIDNHTVQDFDSFDFPNPGRYWVVVDASKFDAKGNQIEEYTSDIYIYVPDQPDENVIVNSRSKPGESKSFSFDEAANQLKSEQTIFLALGLLIPPLLFTLAIKLLSKTPLSEDSLKETFYVQCYYFSPIAFIIWATSYALKYFTPEVFFGYDTDANFIVFLPLALAVFWFISVQTHAIAEEVNINGWFAFVIVLVCIIILLGGVIVVAFGDDPDMQNMARVSSIWIYPILAVGLITAYHILVAFNGRRDSKVGNGTSAVSKAEEMQGVSVDENKAEKKADTSIGHKTDEDGSKSGKSDESKKELNWVVGDKILASLIVIILIITVAFVLNAGQTSNTTSKDYDIAQQSILLQSTKESQQLDSQRFYTDQFDDPELEAWLSPLMMSGEYDQLTLSVQDSRLTFQFSELEDQTPLAYLINNSFSYTDVEMEALVTANDESVKTVSLVCRFNDNGWYEFEISNDGNYVIWVIDANASSFYNPLISGQSSAIRTGVSTNTLRAICKEDIFALYINDEFVDAVRDATFINVEGSVGIGLSSPTGLPVSVDFDYLKLTQPVSVPDVSGIPAPDTQPQGIATPVPTQSQAQFYTDDFKGSMGAWSPLNTGDESQVKMEVEEAGLAFHLSPSGDQSLTSYLMNIDYTYTDVQVDVVTTNAGNNSNGVGIVCQANENGWYEFTVSNTGLYAIYALDFNGVVQEGYTELASGNFASIKTGLSTNTYTAVCSGSEISLFVNGELAETIRDTSFNYGEGNIGILVSSPFALPVDVTINSVTVSEP